MRSSLLLPALAAASTLAAPADKFTFYKMPSFSGPCDLETGSDGNIWISDQLANKIGRLDVNTGKVTEYDVPWTLPPLPESALPQVPGMRGNLACVARSGADGNMYFANGLRNQLLKVNVKTLQMEILNPPGLGALGNLQPFNDAYTAPDGMYFTQTTGNVLTFYEYKTGRYTNYQIPTPLSVPVGVFYASDNNIYVAETIANKIAKFDTKTKKFTEYNVPVPLQGPGVVRAETENRYVWFTGITGGSLIRYDMKTDEVKVIPVPTGVLSVPGENTVDSKGNVWFSTFLQNQISYYTPSTSKFTQIKIPDAITAVPIGLPVQGLNVAMHYGPKNSIWFAQEKANRVGKYCLD